jgi:hypothetical protein
MCERSFGNSDQPASERAAAALLAILDREGLAAASRHGLAA